MKPTLLVCLLFISFYTFSVESITTVGKQKPDDASHSYFIGLLKLALEETEQRYGKTIIRTVPHPGQERVMRLLADGNFYDIVWSGSSIKRNNVLLNIPFPIFKGGLGWRGMVIRKQDSERFSKINSINDLSQLIACQGLHWPDADVLELNGLSVYRASRFDAMLQMVVLKRCDYLPLSIFEGEAELALVSKSFPELVFQQDVILKYPLMMNFFVHKNNFALAERIFLGLTKLDESGRYLHYMQQKRLTKNAFPLEKYRSSKVIELKNTNINNAELKEFGLDWPKK
jgi:hypothetical protein